MKLRSVRAGLAAGVLLGLALVPSSGVAAPAPAAESAAVARATQSCDTHHAFKVCIDYLGGTFYATVFNRGESAPGNGHLVVTDQETWTKSKDGHVAPGDTLTLKYKSGANGHACVGWYYPSNVLIAPWSACIN